MMTAVERVLFGSAVDWNDVDLELQAIEDLDEAPGQTARIRGARSRTIPNGGIRLVRAA